MILAGALLTLYGVGEVRHDWFQYTQAASKENETKTQLREEVLNLASQMETAVKNWGTNDTVMHHQDFDSRFAQWIEEVRTKLSKIGPLPEIIKTYATMSNWTKSDILKLASEFRVIANDLK